MGFVSKDLQQDWIQINVDAASPTIQSFSALGVVAIKHDGQWLGAASIPPPLEAEMGAILLGIHLAITVQNIGIVIDLGQSQSDPIQSRIYQSSVDRPAAGSH